MGLREILVSPLTTQQCKEHQFFNHTSPSLLDRWLVIHSLLWRNRPVCVTFQLPLVLICRHKSFMPPTAGQEPGAETEAEVAEERCLLAGSLWFTLTTLRATMTTSAEVASRSVSWSVPYQSSIKKNAPRLVHRPIWWERFFNWGSHSQNDCSFISS